MRLRLAAAFGRLVVGVGSGAERDWGLPLSGICWYVCATGDGESGSCVRSSLRDRSPYMRRGRASLQRKGALDDAAA